MITSQEAIALGATGPILRSTGVAWDLRRDDPYLHYAMFNGIVGVLNENPSPSEDEIRHGLEGNLCRCTGYHNIVKAVAAVASA